MRKSIVLGIIVAAVAASNIFGAGLLKDRNINQKEFNALHQAGVAIQLADSFDIAYYTENHEYTVGIGGLSYMDSQNTEIYHPTIFARKNIPLTTRLVAGLGLSLGTSAGKIDGINVEDALRVKPYVFFEYAASKHVLIGASVAAFDYSVYTRDDVQYNSVEYLKGSNFQLAILF